MYLPKYHVWTDVQAMQNHIIQHPLGAWVCMSRHHDLIANHIPFFLDKNNGQFGRLIGHVSRANPVWREFDTGASSVVMFMGPNVYISPSFYPSKQVHGRAVPTWNYVTVHAHGLMRVIEDPNRVLEMLHQLTNAQEANQAVPWKVSDAPDTYIQQQLRAIVGIELCIERLEGRLKVSQDEELADRLGTIESLMQTTDLSSQAMAALVQREI